MINIHSFLKNQRGRITYCRWILPSWETTRDTGKNIWNICLKTMERYQGAEVKKAKILKRKQAHRSEYIFKSVRHNRDVVSRISARSWNLAKFYVDDEMDFYWRKDCFTNCIIWYWLTSRMTDCLAGVWRTDQEQPHFVLAGTNYVDLETAYVKSQEQEKKANQRNWEGSK